jgi:hypothetical protein
MERRREMLCLSRTQSAQVRWLSMSGTLQGRQAAQRAIFRNLMWRHGAAAPNHGEDQCSWQDRQMLSTSFSQLLAVLLWPWASPLPKKDE